jgi:hypothetical protein
MALTETGIGSAAVRNYLGSGGPMLRDGPEEPRATARLMHALQDMKDVVTVERRNIERACATWDWVRTAGVSADELRKALMEEQKPEAEKNRGQTPIRPATSAA